MANKNYTMEITLTKAEWEALEKSKPTHKRGNDEGSFNTCKKECGYAFCGGKDAYNKALYERGQFLFTEKYGALLNDKAFPSEAPKAEKPTSTSRGSKGKKVTDDEALFAEFLEFKKFMASKK